MKTVELYEFKDLNKDVKKKVWDKEVEFEVEDGLNVASYFLEDGDLTEEEYYKILGCSKYYAETTGWFIPSCYYEKNRKEVNCSVKQNLLNHLFTRDGQFIQTIESM